ncbi:MAG: MerR family DNA-binding transcriptional regulator [Pseudomonadota bacterium]
MVQLLDFHTPIGATRNVAPDAEFFSIRDLCDAFDVTPRALRFYESQGLISPERDGQRRIYSLRDRARLFLVLRGKRFGFSLAEIRELLDLYDLGDRQLTQLVMALSAGREKLHQLQERRREIDEAIDELENIVDGLEGARREMEAAAQGESAAGPSKRLPKKPVFGELPETRRGERSD